MMALGLSAATLIRTLYWSGPKLSKEAAEHERQIQSAIEKAESESAQQSRGGATPVNPDDGRAYPSEVAKKR